MKRTLYASLLISGMMILTLSSCLKDHEPEIEDIWEVVNIADIEKDITEEWHFTGNELKIYRYNKENPDVLRPGDSGKYNVRNTFKGLFIRITEMADQRFNGDWTVMMLKDDMMILSIEIPGEVLHKEFTKKQSN